MSIPLIDNFNINVKKPIDNRRSVANETERNAIAVSYRWDGMDVFQRDDRKTYTWNDVTQAWSSDDFTLGSGVANAMTFWNSTTTLGSSFLFQKLITGPTGYIGINTNNPKSEVQINSNSGGVPMYLGSNSVGNTISDNILSNGVVDNILRGSSSIYSNNGIVGIGTRAPGTSGGVVDRLIIGYSDFTTVGVHNINSMVDLGVVGGSFVKLSSIKTNVGNVGYVQEFARRNALGGNNWSTYLQHNGISIDNSFLTPGTTKTFWERDPYNSFQYFGSEDKYTFNIDSNFGRIGINTKTPSQTIDVFGNFPTGSGPIIKLENLNVSFPGFKPTYGAGMICKNINSSSSIFIGQMPLLDALDADIFNISLVNSGSNLLSIAKTGQLKLGSLSSSTTSDRMVIANSNNELFQQSIATMMSSANYLATTSKNGLMPKEYINKIDRTRNIGYFGDIEIQATTGTYGSLYGCYGDILTARLEYSAGEGNKILCTMRNPMDNLNYVVKMFIEGRSSDPSRDNDVAVPVFVPVSTTQFRIYIQETAPVVQKFRLHIEVSQY